MDAETEYLCEVAGSMAMYETFARVYDELMDNVPYEEWGTYLIRKLREEGIRDGLVLDLGCGTGKMTRILRDAGYDMIGVDSSEDMLEIAMEREEALSAGTEASSDDALDSDEAASRSDASSDARPEHSSGSVDSTPASILYLLQDMREFELYGTVRAVVSACDCLNYITEEDDLTEVFRLVNNYLDPQGLFIFDMNTLWKYENELGDNTFAEARDDCSFIWENSFDPEERMNEYDLTLFLQVKGDLCRRFSETHIQKAWKTEEVLAALKKSGMELVGIYDAYTDDPARPDSERITVIAREHGK